MKRKILFLAVVFLAIALLATPLAVAKPTSAENNPNSISFMWHSENGYSTIVEGGLKINPPWAEIVDPGPPPVIPDAKVTHSIAEWHLNPEGNNYVQIGEDEDDQIPIEPEQYEGTLYVQSLYQTPTHSLMNYRVYERIMWGESNYIEIMCLERANLVFLPEPPFYDFYASGTFSGHGMVDGVKVQVTGIREGSTQEGIGFVLECYGTIRFAGNA